jgi:hypothetical protein
LHEAQEKFLLGFEMIIKGTLADGSRLADLVDAGSVVTTFGE